MVFSSPLHGSIVDYKTNAVIGGGFDIKVEGATAKDLLDRAGLAKTDKIQVEATGSNIMFLPPKDDA
jgi:hypothetical protein